MKLLRFNSALAVLAVLVAACAPDTTAPNTPDKQAFSGPQLVTNSDPYSTDLDVLVTAELTCLYEKGLLPDENSVLGKWRQIQTAMAVEPEPDLVAATDAMNTLFRYIDLKYRQYKRDNGLTDATAQIDCSGYFFDGASAMLVKPLIDRIKEQINLYITGAGNVCFLPQNNPDIYCASDDKDALVYIPKNTNNNVALAYLSVADWDPSAPIQNIYPEYPNYVQITAKDANGNEPNFADDPIKPIVFVCKNNLPVNEQSIVNRLRLITKHDGTTPAEFAPPPDLASQDQGVMDALAAAQQFCASLTAGINSGPFSTGTVLGRFGNAFASWLLPNALQAQWFEYSYIGGSAERFSDWGIGDPGITIGGSAERFSPEAILSNGPSFVTDPNLNPAATQWGYVFTESRDLVIDHILSTKGVGVEHAQVTWTLVGTDPNGSYADGSDAALCPPTGPVYSDANGAVKLPCINWGTDPGFKNLKAEIKTDYDIDGVTGPDYPEVCVVHVETDADGKTLYRDANGDIVPEGTPGATTRELCTTTYTKYYLVQSLPEKEVQLACLADGTGRKSNLGSLTGNTYTGWFSTKLLTDLDGDTYPDPINIRRVTLAMSITGAASTGADYGVTLSAYSGWPAVDPAPSIAGNRIAYGTQVLYDDGSLAGLQLRGDNGNAQPFQFVLNPTARATAGSTVFFKLTVTSDPTRTPQLWYNGRATAEPCASAIVYAAGTTPLGSPRTTNPGLIVKINNKVWE